MQAVIYARKNKLGKKARTKLTETFAEKNVADFRNLTLLKETQAMKNGLCQIKTLAYQNFD
ncbi:MAG: hypothetical protein HY869_01150 [Chloroflexi bacterium]|nr:hypothetical protein [Chloroflexota bacterium]